MHIMKLVRHYLTQIDFADSLQSIVSLIFFLFFLSIIYFIVTGNKKSYSQYGNLPLEEDDVMVNEDNNNKNE